MSAASHIKFETLNNTHTITNKYIGPVPYPLNDINSNFKVYNPKTGLNEPISNNITIKNNIIKKVRYNNEKN